MRKEKVNERSGAAQTSHAKINPQCIHIIKLQKLIQESAQQGFEQFNRKLKAGT